eukprot:SAG11_NODE_34873_length_269_cov_1.482353_1_plen_40_part_00
MRRMRHAVYTAVYVLGDVQADIWRRFGADAALAARATAP